jgi:branched-chain amino acid transport system permease protein
MTEAAALLAAGLADAARLFLLAAGLTLVFGVCRIANFAHGSLYMLGAYLGYALLTRLPGTGLGFACGAGLVGLGLAAAGAGLERALLRRLRGSPPLLQLLLTYGLALVVTDLLQHLAGAEELTLPRPAWMRGALSWGGLRLPHTELLDIGLALAVGGALALLLGRTPFGRRLRAARERPDLLAALGIDPAPLFTAVLALGGGLAGLAGVLALPEGSAHLGMDIEAVTEAFAVVVVGGLGRLDGAAAASLLFGLLEAAGVVFFPEATRALPFLIMAGALLLRPGGLLGEEEREQERISPLAPPGRDADLAWVLGLLLAAAAPLLFGRYGLEMASEAMLALLFAMSLHLVMGIGGMPSFGHAAWFGLGAYGAALCARGLPLSFPAGLAFPLALAAGAALAGAAAFFIGGLAAGLEGVYLAMFTLAWTEILAAGAAAAAFTGGDDGILGLRPPPFFRTPAHFYWLTLALGGGGALVLREVMLSPFGYTLRALRDAPERSAAVGVDRRRVRLAAFTLAGAAAGLAGAIYAFLKASVFPDYFDLDRSVEALLMVLLGGGGTWGGPMLGAALYTLLADLLLAATDHWRLFFGLLLIGLVLLAPDGVGGLLRRVPLLRFLPRQRGGG